METDKKMQCWNYNNCGHGKDSLCPAVVQKAGRSCWLVAKTLCGGKVHGKHTQRIKACAGCGFYIYIHLAIQAPDTTTPRVTRGVKGLCSNLPRT